MWAFVRLGRPHFLLGGALMYAIGVRGGGGTSVGNYVLGQALVTSAQLTAHYANEYADRHADQLVKNRTLFSGGSGVLPAGLLTPGTALRAGRVTSVLAVGLAAAVASISLLAAILGLVALGVSWAYSAPPVRLLDTGWGELVTSVVVTVLVPMIGALVASGSIGGDLMWAMAALLAAHLMMMLAFELPDLETDRAAHKPVLAVRLGASTTRRLMLGLLAIPVVVVSVAVAAASLDRSAWWAIVAGAVPAGMVIHASKRGHQDLLTASAVATLVLLGGGLLFSL